MAFLSADLLSFSAMICCVWGQCLGQGRQARATDRAVNTEWMGSGLGHSSAAGARDL